MARAALARGLDREPGDSGLVALAEHALSALDPRPQPLLEILVLLALGDVRADRSADDLGHGLIVYGATVSSSSAWSADNRIVMALAGFTIPSCHTG